jgi:hypothetical protein
MLLLPELISGADCPLLFVGGNTTARSNLVQSGIAAGLRVLSIRLFELAEQLDARGMALARKVNIVD